MVTDEHHIVCHGLDTVFIGDILVENGDVFVKKRPTGRLKRFFMPWKKDWVLLTGNVGEKLKVYTEKKLIDMRDGRTDVMVRVYPWDIDTGKEDFTKINSSMLREYKSVIEERDYLLQLWQDIKIVLESGGLMDIMKSKFKDEYAFFTGLKPDYMMHSQQSGKKDEKKK